MSFAATSFGTVHYRLTGPADGPVIVLCNSLGTDFHIWDAFLAALPPGYRVLAYDKRGHGLSSVPAGPYSIAQLAADLVELADSLGIGRFALIGVSIGGMIGQRLALDHPDRLAGLVLCDTAPKVGDAAFWSDRMGRVAAGGMEAIADAVMLRWFPETLRPNRETELTGWRNLLLRSPADGYIATCAALRDADLSAEIAAINTPTLVLVGSDDQSTPVALVRALADGLPDARFEVVEAAGHLPMIDQPDKLARLVALYLEEVGHV